MRVTDRQTVRVTDRQTVRVTDRQTVRVTDRQIENSESNSKTLFYKDCSLVYVQSKPV